MKESFMAFIWKLKGCNRNVQVVPFNLKQQPTNLIFCLPILVDLQFALAHQTASAETEAELRSFIVGLQVESDSNKDLVLSLQAELERSQQKVIELEDQLRWQQLQSQNQLNVKEAKIKELKRGSSEGGKATTDQNKVKQRH